MRALWSKICAVTISSSAPVRRSKSSRPRFTVAGEPTIVFVHGYVCNRGFWTPWMARCHRERRPFVAVNLEPPFASIDDMTT